MPDTLREKVAILSSGCDGCGERCPLRAECYAAADRILSLTEADAREREKKAWMGCHRWEGSFKPTDEQAEAESERRYGGK